MPVAVHVRIGIRRRAAYQIECVFEAEVIKDRRNDKNADDDSVPDKFVGDYRLDKEREQDEGKDLGEGNEVKLFDILEQLVVMIASDSLHEDAAKAGNRKQNDLDETQSEEL